MKAPQMPADLPPGLPTSQPQDVPSAGLFVRLYVTGWFLLSGLAVGYFTLLLVNPEAVARISAFTWSADMAQKPQRTNTQLAIELDAVRRTIADVQRDLAYVKSNLLARLDELASSGAHQEPAAAAVSTQPTAAPPGMLTTIPFAAPGLMQAPAERTELQAPAAPFREVRPQIADKEPDKTLDKTGDEALSRQKGPAAPSAKLAVPLETGSVPPQQPRIAFGPATVVRAPKPVGIMLESSTSLESLRVRWSMLQETHGTVLKNLQPRYVGSADTQSYQLVAGPIATLGEAKRVCALLRVKNVSCSLMSTFSGEQL